MQGRRRRAAAGGTAVSSRRCEAPLLPLPALGTRVTAAHVAPWHAACSKERMELLQSCEHLRREHQLIADVVAGLGALAERRQVGADVPLLPIAGALDFFTGFVAG